MEADSLVGVEFSIDDRLALLLSSQLNITTGDFTVVFEMQTTSTVRGKLVWKELSSFGFFVEMNVFTAGKLRIFFGDGSFVTGESTSSNYNNGEPIIVIITFDRSGNATFYRNAVPDGTVNISARTGSISNGSVFTLGTNNAQFYTGVLNEFGMYSSLLTQDEIDYITDLKLRGTILEVQRDSLLTYNTLRGPVGASADGDIFQDLSGNDNNFIGNDGANDIGLTYTEDERLSDRPNIFSVVPGVAAALTFIPYPKSIGLHGGMNRNMIGGIG